LKSDFKTVRIPYFRKFVEQRIGAARGGLCGVEQQRRRLEQTDGGGKRKMLEGALRSRPPFCPDVGRCCHWWYGWSEGAPARMRAFAWML
jgi:hypothetical protein